MPGGVGVVEGATMAALQTLSPPPPDPMNPFGSVTPIPAP
jgi:hypothetical protein